MGTRKTLGSALRLDATEDRLMPTAEQLIHACWDALQLDSMRDEEGTVFHDPATACKYWQNVDDIRLSFSPERGRFSGKRGSIYLVHQTPQPNPADISDYSVWILDPVNEYFELRSFDPTKHGSWSQFGEDYRPMHMYGSELFALLAMVESYQTIMHACMRGDKVDWSDEERRYRLMESMASHVTRKLTDHYGHRLTGPGHGHIHM